MIRESDIVTRMPGAPSATFRPFHIRLLVAFTIVALWLALPIFVLLIDVPGIIGSLLFAASLMLVVLLVLRAFRIELRVDGREVKVVNFARSRSIGWEQIARVGLSGESLLVDGLVYGIEFTLRDGTRVISQASLGAGRTRDEMSTALERFAEGWPVSIDLSGRVQ